MRYTIGDKVLYGGLVYTVIRMSMYDSSYVIKSLKTGEETEVSEWVLNKVTADGSVCVICGNYFKKTESPIHGKKEIWEDCITCNKTKEAIVKQFTTSTTLEDKSLYADWLFGID